MGAVCALLPALGVLGPPLVGLLADALGLRHALLRIVCFGAWASMGMLAVVSATLPRLPFGLLFVMVLLYAVFRSPLVMLADVVTLEHVRRGEAPYGRIRLWGSLGFLVAAATTGHLVDPRAPAALPAVIAGGLLVAFLAAWALPARPAERSLPAAPEARALRKDPDFGQFLLITLLAQTAHSAHDLCLSLHVRDRGGSTALAGSAWAIGVAFEVLLMAWVEPLMARVSPRKLLSWALLGATTRWVLMGSLGSVPALLMVQPLHALSFALWWVASVGYLKERVPAHGAATAQGLFGAAGAMGSVTGMLVWGWVYRRAGGSVVFGIAALIAFGAAMLAARWARLRTAPPNAAWSHPA